MKSREALSVPKTRNQARMKVSRTSRSAAQEVARLLTEEARITSFEHPMRFERSAPPIGLYYRPT
jgi:hypothetical protein